MRWTNEHKHNTSTALKMAVTKVIKTMTGHCLDCNKMYYYAFFVYFQSEKVMRKKGFAERRQSIGPSLDPL